MSPVLTVLLCHSNNNVVVQPCMVPLCQGVWKPRSQRNRAAHNSTSIKNNLDNATTDAPKPKHIGKQSSKIPASQLLASRQIELPHQTVQPPAVSTSPEHANKHSSRASCSRQPCIGTENLHHQTARSLRASQEGLRQLHQSDQDRELCQTEQHAHSATKCWKSGDADGGLAWLPATAAAARVSAASTCAATSTSLTGHTGAYASGDSDSCHSDHVQCQRGTVHGKVPRKASPPIVIDLTSEPSDDECINRNGQPKDVIILPMNMHHRANDDTGDSEACIGSGSVHLAVYPRYSRSATPPTCTPIAACGLSGSSGIGMNTTESSTSFAWTNLKALQCMVPLAAPAVATPVAAVPSRGVAARQLCGAGGASDVYTCNAREDDGSTTRQLRVAETPYPADKGGQQLKGCKQPVQLTTLAKLFKIGPPRQLSITDNES